MSLQNYHDEDNRQRVALIVKESRKWMTLLVVECDKTLGPGLVMVRRPLTDQRYMTPLQGSDHKAKASMRRLARRRGTSRKIRDALRESL